MRGFITLGELRKLFNVFSNNIDCEVLTQGGKIFKSYLKNQ
jgi:hypothetical protein